MEEEYSSKASCTFSQHNPEIRRLALIKADNFPGRIAKNCEVEAMRERCLKVLVIIFPLGVSWKS